MAIFLIYQRVSCSSSFSSAKVKVVNITTIGNRFNSSQHRSSRGLCNTIGSDTGRHYYLLDAPDHRGGDRITLVLDCTRRYDERFRPSDSRGRSQVIEHVWHKESAIRVFEYEQLTGVYSR